VIDISFAQLQGWIALFLWPFARIAAFIASAPLFGHASVPARVKIGIAALLTVAVSSALPTPPPAAILSWSGLGILIEQFLIGVAMGLALHILFAAVQAAGEFIGLQMGLAFATFFSSDTGTNTAILSRLLYMLALLMFLAFNGHLMTIEVLAASFVTLPIGVGGLQASAFELLVRFAGTLFVSGLLLALPLVAALLIINLAMGILNRAAPQITVFSVSLPVSLTAGIFLMTLLMNDLGRFLQGLFSEGLRFMQELVLVMAGA